MTRVLLVSSTHREWGRATAGELRCLLGTIRPEVVFLEHSPSDFSTFLDGTCRSLESAALRGYLGEFPVQLVPVDLPTPDATFKEKFDLLFDRVEEASTEFRHLAMLNGHDTAAGGFAYLNSGSSDELQTAMQRVMRATVEHLADPSVAEIYRLWVRANDLREEAMLDAVEAYAGRSPFTKGVLLVGAAHVPSLLDKAHARHKDAASAVVWDIEWRFNEPQGNGSN